MSIIVEAPEIIRAFLSCSDFSSLTEILARAATTLGFERFAMGHHVDLMTPPENVVRVTNYDPAWIDRALEGKFYRDDPVHFASTRTAAGFLWSNIATLVSLNARQTMILTAAREYGLCEGYTVPVHVPGEYRGTCSFGTASGQIIDENRLPFANLVGLYAFEAARKIVRASGAHLAGGYVPVLTDRQRDTLVLVARGKADSEIAILMGISRSTAHEHVENIRRAYGNAQRTNLVARALFDGQISYSDVLTGRRGTLWVGGL